MRIPRFFTALLFLAAGFVPVKCAPALDLSGQWSVTLRGDSTPHPIALPGTTDMAGLGEPDTLAPELRKPQLLHLTRRHRYVGPASYTRDITVPGDMAGRPLRLTLERVMWRSTLAVDGHDTGQVQESLTTPHCFDLPEGLTEGTHRLTLGIDNSRQYDISVNNLAHAYTDDTQTMWNGVLGEMSLRVLPTLEIADMQVYPDVGRSAAEVKAVIVNRGENTMRKLLKWEVGGLADGKSARGRKFVTLHPGENPVSVTVKDTRLGKSLWSEFTPTLLTLSMTLDGESRRAEFGMREMGRSGRQLTVNGVPVFLRGTLECCVFPLTGTPPTTEEGWEPVFTAAREWGLNHLRFHSWCPPEAVFRVADRMGFYLQVECPLWSVSITADSVGANGDVKRFIREEFDRIVSTYGNHPSLCMMTVGNELQKDFDWLNRMTAHMHAADPRRLYAATSFTFEKGHGGHAEENDDFLVTQWTDDGWVRGQGVFDAEPPAFDRNYAASTARLTVPLIEHEIGQYAVYPDLREINHYTGVLDPLNFKAVRADLERKGKLGMADKYLKASGKLAALLYKEEVERAMKTPGVSGFQLLGLQDFPGQGTALVGLLNAFWESKGIVSPEWFRQFCGPVVPLAEFPKAVYTGGETFRAILKASAHIPDPGFWDARWSLTDGTDTIGSGTLSGPRLTDGLITLGDISVPLPVDGKARRMQLTVELPSHDASNSWSIWVYPAEISADTSGITVTRDIDTALASAAAGEKVLFMPHPDSIRGKRAKFVPVFWSPVHFPKEAGAMGIICDPAHPALASFPNDGHTDWQWWHPVKRSAYTDISFIKGLEPVIGMVDNFTTNRTLALMFEAKVGNGSVMFCGIDLMPEDGSDPATRQLLRSVTDYMRSDAFIPAVSLSAGQLRQLVK